jgi:hypothetical protein
MADHESELAPMPGIVDLNSGSASSMARECSPRRRQDQRVDAALEGWAGPTAARPSQRQPDQRPCGAWRADPTHPDDGMLRWWVLRIEAGRQLRPGDRLLQAAGFDLRAVAGTVVSSASITGGRILVTSMGVIVGGASRPQWRPFEHKALNQKSWTDLVKRGLRQSKPVYFAQCQLYMAYMELEVALLTAMNKNTQELYHEVVLFDPADAQKLSDRAVDILRRWADELPPDRDRRLPPLPDVPYPHALGG